MKIFVFLMIAGVAHAKINVVTSLTDLAAITREVGGDEVQVESIAKGTQDPHYLEAKPSFMTKMSKADLLITIGLGLEVGWIPSLVRGARNPKITGGMGV
jgi:zinc/manganese transport system substrate-binding protein